MEWPYLSTGEPAQWPEGQVYSITVAYEEPNIPPSVDESSLGLYAWNNGGWEREATSVVDPQANTVFATPNHFSSWAILVEEHNIYLPCVVRNAVASATTQVNANLPVGVPATNAESCIVDQLR